MFFNLFILKCLPDVSIKSVKTYLNKTRFEAKDLVSEFQDVIQNSPHDAGKEIRNCL